MTNEYFVTGQVKKDEYHINTSNKYLHNHSKTICFYHFPTYYMWVYIVPKAVVLRTAAF